MASWYDSWLKNKVIEKLDEDNSLLWNYLDRNPQRLDKYVIQNVDEMRINDWLKRVDGPLPTETLQTLRVDYLKEKNGKAQHTGKYANDNLIVRRAAKFDLDIYFKNRSFTERKDKLTLEFGIGENQTLGNKTLFRASTSDKLQKNKWSSIITKIDDKKKMISVQVSIPADAIIGRYNLTIEATSWLDDQLKTTKKSVPDIFVLFNPFSKDDEVYMEQENKRNEYVLNDTGIIYYGQYYKIGGMHWLFGQFEPGILEIALKLLREAPNVKKNPVKSTKKRSSAVYCSRTLSAMVNCNDDDGVLYGRWDGEYKDGKRPTTWKGSVKILKEWNGKDMAEVKYGQCWVFSGVLTTVLRAIGIPARSVTNFQSAHDTEFNMTIDRFIDENGDESETMNSDDSIWNFHVWNEGWFQRPDLPKGYDGWQAVDATPQEESSGTFQCGPAPVKAVKNGEIYIGYDTNFVFSEVNADRLTWKVNKEGEVDKLVRRETHHVGRNISTKAVGSDKREDITHEYKYPEGSPEERKAFDRAYAFGMKAPYHEKFDVIEDEGDITIEISDVGEAINGKTITISVKVRNNTKVNKTAMITTAINTILHTGERKTLILKKKIETTLGSKKESDQVFKLPFADYGRYLADDNVIQVFTTVRVKETGNFYVDSLDLQVKSPDCLKIKCQDTMKTEEYVDVSFTFTNPLPVTLTAGVFSLEGSGVISEETVKISEPIPPNATIETPSLEIQPYRLGEVKLIADFDCNEISNIKSTKDVNVVWGGMM